MISPALNGLLKGLLLVVILAVTSFFGDAAHLTPLVGNLIATLVAAVASAIESNIKDKTGNGLFGVVRVNRTIPSGY